MKPPLKIYAVQCHQSNETRVFASSSPGKAVRRMTALLQLGDLPDSGAEFYTVMAVEKMEHYTLSGGKMRKLRQMKSTLRLRK